MVDPRTQQTPIAPRKRPRQTRSSLTVEAVLEAAAQVLARYGGRGFTTTRVAERAGVSIGSLYQYFPNKAALLFHLQRREWQATAAVLLAILGDHGTPSPGRLRALVHAFVRSECAEAEMRLALHEAAPDHRQAAAYQDARAADDQSLEAPLRELLADVPDGARARVQDLVRTTLCTMAERFSTQPRSRAEIDAYAESLADMLSAYVQSQGPG